MSWKILSILSKISFFIQIIVCLMNANLDTPLTWTWLIIGFVLGFAGQIIKILERANEKPSVIYEFLQGPAFVGSL